MSAFNYMVSFWNGEEIKAFSDKIKTEFVSNEPILKDILRIFVRKKENYPGKLKDAVRNKKQRQGKFLSKSKLYGLYKRIISCGVQKYVELKHM